MAADNNHLHSLLKTIEAEISHLRADVYAQITSQPIRRSNGKKGRNRDSHQQRPWEKIEKRLKVVYKVIHRLESRPNRRGMV
ncbi:hypothetical protein QL093DRAFT_2545104 [Fusarium oxysporum]|nr:hypothetical protein QL093DRAFT_2545104 [Fusarium oxysporum]